MLPSTKLMPAARECPLCGATMRLKQTDIVIRVPGDPQPRVGTSAEWTCPDCDYYEEAEEEGSATSTRER
jgi:rubredoxin